MKKFLIFLVLLWGLGSFSVKAKEFVGQLVLNYQDTEKDAVYPYALVTDELIIPLTFESNEFRRTLNRFSGDIIVVEGEVKEVTVPGINPADFPMGVDLGFVAGLVEDSTRIDGINVHQFSLPVISYEFEGKMSLKYIPEQQRSVFLLNDDTGVTRKIFLPKYEKENYLEEYYEKRVRVKCRLVRYYGGEILFASSVERI